MKFFNSLTGQITNWNKDSINIYACGPTVYNYIHIGNARAIVLPDILVRYLESKNIKVNYLMNVTDIDDKIINRAVEEKQDELSLSSFYCDKFLTDLKNLNVKTPTNIIKISTKIPEMINFISRLIDLNFAYESNGSVYFDINKAKTEYGKLANKNIDELLVGTRKELDNAKINPLDFVLWKKTTIGVTYDSPWSKGRPGWHTECSLLIDEYFEQQTIDIHLGGIDLKFPHHENSRIQFIAKNQKEIADIWMHNGHLNVSGEKMSKSLNNFVLLKDFIQDYSANTLRWIFISSSYQNPLNMSDDLVKQASKWIDKIQMFNKNILQTMIEQSVDNLKNFSIDKFEFEKHMDNDLNTPQVITLVDNLIKKFNKTQDLNIAKTINHIISILGFDLEPLFESLTKSNVEMFKQWKQLIAEKEFVQADKLRTKLQKAGLI